MKRNKTFVIPLFLLVTFISIFSFSIVNADQSKTSNTYKVYQETFNNPGFYIVRAPSGTAWYTQSDVYGSVMILDDGKGMPVKSSEKVRTRTTLSTPLSFIGEVDGRTQYFPASNVKNIRIRELPRPDTMQVVPNMEPQVTGYNATTYDVEIRGFVGGNVPYYREFTSGDNTKGLVYNFPMITKWEAEVTLDYELKITPDYHLSEVGEEVQYRAYLNGHDVTNRPEVTWSIQNANIGSITSSGRVTGKQEGLTKVTVGFKDSNRNLDLIATADYEVMTGEEHRFRVDPKEITIYVGDEQQFNALYYVPVLGREINMNDRSNWTITDSSIATTTDKGFVRGVKEGTVTLTATLDSDGQTWVDTAIVHVIQNRPDPGPDIGPPVADFTFNPSSPTTFDTIQFTDRSYHPFNVEIVDWQWRIDNQPFSIRNPSYSPREMGGFYATLTVTDKNGLSDSTTKPIEVRDPPIAIIDAPTTVKAGERVLIDGRRSYDPWGGSIDEYRWNIPAADRTLTGSNGSVMFMEVGQARIELSVRNDINLWGHTNHVINVLPPTPKSNFLVGGYLKENRKVTIEDQSETPEGYPIDWNKSYYEITPLDNQDIESIRYHGNLNKELLNVLFKENGRYRIYQYIENTYGLSDDSTQTITIAIDEEPVADFATPGVIYRDPNNENLAKVDLRDNSRSPDEDIIQERIWMYRYDQENQYRDQMSFESEEWMIIDDANNSSINFNVEDVGYYEIRLLVKEDFGQPTILDFITDEDYRRSESVSKIIKVDNHAPSIDWVTSND